jgi:hypothetical protein
VRRFFVSVRVQMGGMMWASSPTDKPLICALEFSFYHTVKFAAGGASPSPTLLNFKQTDKPEFVIKIVFSFPYSF